MWKVLADVGSVDQLQAQTPILDDLPTGTPINIHCELPWWMPAGWLANVGGAEQIAGFFVDAQVQINDVRSEDVYSLDIDGIAVGSPVVLIVIAIAGALVALGIAYAVTRIVISADLKEREAARIEEVNKLLDEGYTIDEAKKILDSVTPPTPPEPGFLGLPTWALPVGLVVAGLVLLSGRK